MSETLSIDLNYQNTISISAVPNEIRAKAGPKRFRAIFVGYEEHWVGWHVHNVEGKYSFSNDVIFNENLLGHLGVPHSLSSPSSPAFPVSPRVQRAQPRVRTVAGQAYDEVIKLRACLDPRAFLPIRIRVRLSKTWA